MREISWQHAILMAPSNVGKSLI
ncbi:hypothetical protein IL54_2118 [Sphingobium sp. ba1]|nr:hypothetical protein IL54_2118 [Sphingobium sp. ba1]